MLAHSWGFADVGTLASLVTLVLGLIGLVIGWFVRLSYKLHVSDFRFQTDNYADGVAVTLSLGVRNTSSIPLRFQVVEFTVRAEDDEFPLSEDHQRADVSPNQVRLWLWGPRLFPDDAYPLAIEVEYAIDYGRRYGLTWWMRRRIRGSFRVTVPARAGRIEALAVEGDVPMTDKLLISFKR